jgi:hypothetical protein
MKNITLSMDEETLRRARDYATSHGTTLNQMVRDLLAAKITPAAEASPLEEGFRLADAAGADSRGWRWNREEVHDDRRKRSK